jgi:SAM-dependent methyltransferase
MQAHIDRANAAFWDELCGTGLARAVGITDHSLESLRRFDRAYFDEYPYLLGLIRPARMTGKRVLEIGPGYGSVGQTIAEAGASYTALDIAANPVRMMQTRLRLVGLPGTAVQGSAVAIPLPDASMDYVVSIGCLHHTGNVQRCFDEVYRVLRPGGAAVVMVYNKFAWRQWRRWPGATLRALIRDLSWRPRERTADRDQIAAYDRGANGRAAPETVFLSIRDLRAMLRDFASVRFTKQNCDPWVSRRGPVVVSRARLLPTLGRVLGLDIYLEARKAATEGSRHAA